jgi:hypothetical protein
LVQLQAFLNLAKDEGKSLASCFGPSIHGKFSSVPFVTEVGWTSEEFSVYPLGLTSRSLFEFIEYFGEKCHLHIKSRRTTQARNQDEAGSKQSSSTLKKEMTCSSESQADFYCATGDNSRSENLISYPLNNVHNTE